MKIKIVLLACLLFSYKIDAQNIENYLKGGVVLKTLGTSTNGVKLPRDLDFRPGKAELWVVNKGGTTTSIGPGEMVVFTNATSNNPTSSVKKEGGSNHFFNSVASFSFSNNDDFAGIYELENSPGDTKWFMGPSLFRTTKFGTNYSEGWSNNHLDMLHQSPLSMGIENEKDNIYWVFDGRNGNICKYNFHVPHSLGGADHSDGELARYSEVTVLRKPGIPSHLVRDKSSKWLYIVDTGNKRILRLDASSGTKGTSIKPFNENLNNGYYQMKDVSWSVYINSNLVEPSGIDYKNGRLIVSDHSNGDIIIYNTTGQNPVEMGRIKTGASGIMGVKIGPDNKIYFVNYKENKVQRLEYPEITSSQDASFNGSFEVSPNPTDGEVTIDLTNPSIEKMEVALLDLNGKLIKNFSEEVSSGHFHHSVNLKDLSILPGIYVLKAQIGEMVSTKKICLK